MAFSDSQAELVLRTFQICISQKPTFGNLTNQENKIRKFNGFPNSCGGYAAVMQASHNNDLLAGK